MTEHLVLKRTCLAIIAIGSLDCSKSQVSPIREPVDGEYQSIEFRKSVTPTATITTQFGDIKFELIPDSALVNCKNFTYLSDLHFYDGLTIHRVIPNFVIQGGDPNGDGSGGAGYDIPDEHSAIPFEEGTVGMVRRTEPNTASSQFFICLSRLPSLDGRYTVIGRVTDGMDVAHEIGELRTGPANKPLEPVVIRHLRVER